MSELRLELLVAGDSPRARQAAANLARACDAFLRGEEHVETVGVLVLEKTAGLFSSTTPSLRGGGSVTAKHISTLTDSIILLRCVESFDDEMLRSILLLKMRGSHHDSMLQQYKIDGAGMHIGEPFRDIAGILSGHPTFEAHGSVQS